MSNVVCNAQSWQTGMFVWILETNYPGRIWTVATQVKYTPFVLEFLANLKDPHIVYMEILLPISIQSIKPNARMIQTLNISCGANHQSWSHKVAKYQDRVICMLEIKLPSMMTNLCV